MTRLLVIRVKSYALGGYLFPVHVQRERTQIVVTEIEGVLI